MLEEPSPVAELVLTNQASLPADDLTGSWLIDTDDFNLTSFAPFSDLAAGNAITGPLVSLADISPANFFADLTLSALSVNARGSTPLSDISLAIRVSRILEPSSLVWMVFAALWLFRPAARASRP